MLCYIMLMPIHVDGAAYKAERDDDQALFFVTSQSTSQIHITLI